MSISDGFWFQVGRGFAELAMAFGVLFFIFFVAIIASIFNAWRNGKI
jgi:cbb3-type cytochrome oxidase subunit 3